VNPEDGGRAGTGDRERTGATEEARDQAGAGPLPEGLRRTWVARAWPGEGARIAVACSGGVDSLSLLHLLRFPLADLGLELSVAHFDHRMRSSGRADVEWMAGVAGAWGLPLHRAEAARLSRNEAEARTARYRFLKELVESDRVDRVLTAHHADDQVETVLFRILRGTGVEGLRGIPEERSPGILRPLLARSRQEIEAYAERHGLRPREDPSNRSSQFARNRIRHELLPLAEAIHPGARRAIHRLARNAREAADLVDTLLEERLGRFEVEKDNPRAAGARGTGFGVSLDRPRLLTEVERVQRALIRLAARRVGATLSRTGTATALQFMRGGSSGRALRLPGGLVIEREFDVVRVHRVADPHAASEDPADEFGDSGESGPTDPVPDTGDIPLQILGATAGAAAGHGAEIGTGAAGGTESAPVSAGSGRLRVGGRWFEAQWSPGTDVGSEWSAIFDPTRITFPLSLRGWRPGDRTRTEGGGRKLKKLFGERRVPAGDRHRWPLLVEGDDEVLWIPGLHRSPRFVPGEEGSSWAIEVRVVDEA